MTKATIITNHGEAEYTVQLELNTQAAEARSAELADKIIEYTALIATATIDWLGAENDVDAKLAELDAAIIADAEKETLDALIAEAMRLRATADAKRIEYDRLVATKLSMSSQKTNLDNRIAAAVQPQVRIWCADYSEDLTGTVAVIVVPAENTGADLVIRPGFASEADWEGAVHGWLTPPWSQSAAQAFYNYAMLPGFQTWMPTYRYGVLSNLAGNTGDVTLEAAVSSAQDLDVNRETVLSGVEIDYMDCHGGAFENGDRVVVRFDDKDKSTPEANWDNPKVVGFVTNPRPCDDDLFISWRTASSGSESASSLAQLRPPAIVSHKTDVPTPVTGGTDGINFTNLGRRGRRYATYVEFDEVAPAGATTDVRVKEWDANTGSLTLKVALNGLAVADITTASIFADANTSDLYVSFGRSAYPNEAYINRYTPGGAFQETITLSRFAKAAESVNDLQVSDSMLIVASPDDSYGQAVYVISLDPLKPDLEFDLDGENGLLSVSDSPDLRIFALTGGYDSGSPVVDIFVWDDEGVLLKKNSFSSLSGLYVQISANRAFVAMPYSRLSDGKNFVDIYTRTGASGETLVFSETIDLTPYE